MSAIERKPDTQGAAGKRPFEIVVSCSKPFGLFAERPIHVMWLSRNCKCLDRHMPIKAYYGMASTFELLADPTRRRVLDELRNGQCSVGMLAERLNMNQPAISKQLRVLREAGLASVQVDAQRRIYSLNPEGLREIDDWLVPYRSYWQDRLNAMERTLESLED